MRFAYIDSNGNEVPIPSVDALALRIELGAITDTTQLYDAQADQWGPADTHEIFHTLARSAGSDEGFVGPPPVAPEPVPPPSAPEPAAPESDDVPLSIDVPEAVDAGLTLAEPSTPSEPDDAAAGLGLTLADAPPVEPSPTSGSPESEDLGLGGLDLAPAQASEAPEVSDMGEAAGDGEGAGEGVFDFGDMDGGLEFEDASSEAAGDEADGAMDFSGGFGEGIGMGESPDFSGGLELEGAMDFSLGTPESGVGDSLDLETPMSQFTPEDPPAWMDGDTGDSGDSGQKL